MTAANLDSVLRLVRKLSDGQEVRSLSDGELLERFRAHGEEAAFALLVERHGPMVLDVCRRCLGNAHDAEDAFQATFLVLVRKAASIRSRDSVPSWLHGVARRVSGQARLRARRRQDVVLPPPPIPPTDPGANLTWDELRTLVDEEMGRLPEDQRAAVILCCLEGRSQDQAAKELGCPKSTLSSRLEKGRETLRRRLARRGFALSAGALASVLAAAPASASLPAMLLIAAVRNATLATKGAVDAGVVSAEVLALTTAAVRSMTPWKLTLTVLAACVLLTGAATLAYHGLRDRPAVDPPRPAGTVAEREPPNQGVPKKVVPPGVRERDRRRIVSLTRSRTMRSMLPLAGLLLFAFTPDAQAGDPSIETVENDPPKYAGQTLVFDNVKLSGKMIKHSGLWCMKITTPDGKEYSAAAKFGARAFGTFFVPEDIADRLRDDLKEDDTYTVRITGKVYKKKWADIGAEGWVTEVSKVDFYTDGKVTKTIDAKSPRSAKAPTLERLVEAPQKFNGQTLTFDKVKLAGKMIKHTGVWCLKITDEEGTSVGAAVAFVGGITFMVSEEIADRLRDDLNEDKEYVVKLTCKVSKKKFVSEGAEAWMAEVSQLDFYADGKVTKTIDAKSPRSGKAPTLERVVEAPPKFNGQTLVFDKVKLGGKMIKHSGVWCMQITSEDGGTVVGASVSFGRGMAFAAPDKLAERIMREIKEGNEYTVKVTAKVSKKKFPDEAWIAEVSQVEFYRDDKIVKSIK
jgi:RNA polymerase sigma factor (sigma-70 family)